MSKTATACNRRDDADFVRGVQWGPFALQGMNVFVSYVDERVNTDPSACCGEGYPEPHKKLALIQKLSAMAGESWQSFYSRTEFKALLADAGFAITEEKTLADLNDEYFAPANRLIPQSNLLKLERLIVGKNTNMTCREIT